MMMVMVNSMRVVMVVVRRVCRLCALDAALRETWGGTAINTLIIAFDEFVSRLSSLFTATGASPGTSSSAFKLVNGSPNEVSSFDVPRWAES